MPLKFNNTDEARKLILDKARKWRAALEKAKSSKDGVKEVANTMVSATDTLVSTQTYTLDVLANVQAKQLVMQGGNGQY